MAGSSRLPALLISALTVLGCSKDEQRSAPPPPAPTAQAKTCEAGGGTVGDASLASAFPRNFAGYCVDPHGETRMYGEGASKPIDSICLEAFNGDCDVYKGFGLRKTSIFRYVDGGGGSGSIDVVVSRFGSVDGAYGMFTQRVISDADPAREGAPRVLSVPGAGALGTGMAYLWNGPLLVELTYTNDRQTPQQLAETSAKMLSTLAEQTSPKLGGESALPAAAAALPEQDRLPLGIVYEPKDAFGVAGAGAGATGFYRAQDQRYRVLSILRQDREQAEDVLRSLVKDKGASVEKNLGEGAVRMMVGGDDSPRAEWFIARKANRVVGVGDERAVLQPNLSASERAKKTLSREQKIARLKELLAEVK